MSETDTANAGETTTETVTNEFDAITSQEDFDSRIQARLDRERKKYGDYEELKARAGKFTELEEANRTESEKIADRLAAAEKRAAELEGAALKASVAEAKGVPSALLSGSTQEELEAAADALIAFRGEQKHTPSSSAIGRANTTDKVQAPTSPGMGSLRAAYAEAERK